MSWEVYRKKRVTRHDFEELFCPDFWVDLLSMDTASYGKSKEFQNFDPNDEESQRKMEEMLAGHIVDWCITDPETDEPLLVPTKKDPTPLYTLPNEFIATLYKWIGEDSKVDKLVPRSSETFSGQL